MTDGDVPLRINLGCGERWMASWRNLDGGPWTRLHRLRSLPIPESILPGAVRRYPPDLVRWDLRRVPLPFETDSASVVFTQYVLEYLTEDESLRVLAECWRVLRPGGLIRLNQTDIGAIIAAYGSDDGLRPGPRSVVRAHQFLDAVAPAHTTLSARLFRRGGVQQLFDGPKLEWMLLDAGFTDIRFQRLNEGQCPDLAELERDWDPPLLRVEALKSGADRAPRPGAKEASVT